MANWRGFFGSLFGGERGAPDSAGPVVSQPQPAANHEAQRHKRDPAPPNRNQSVELYQPGDVIAGNYEIQRKLGEGGFGLVYLAYSRNTGEVFALKTFRDEFLTDAAGREAFKMEALLWVSLERHPSILAAWWVQVSSGRLFVVMEYVAPDEQDRVSLQDHLKRAVGPLPLEQTLRWGVQFCQGMEHAARHGIQCHRDIKPANLLIAEDGTLKISDFGLAVAVESAWQGTESRCSRLGDGRPGCSMVVTQGRRVCGTPGYMAPEVFEGKGADVRSDVYSFGIVLWQMAAGSAVAPYLDTLYQGDPLEYQERLHERLRAGDLPRVDGPLHGVINGCLANDRSQRPRDFRALKKELAKLYRRETGSSMPVLQPQERTLAVWASKGASLDTLGRHEEAIRCHDQALEINPRNAAVWTNKGISLNNLCRYEEAIHCCDQALEIDPRAANAWNNKGNSLNSLGRHEEATRCYDQALKIDPKFANAWSNKGCSLNNQGRYEEALRCLDQALDIAPRFAGAWDNKGNSLNSLGRYEEALRCYDQALEIDPRDANAWDNKGCSLNNQGRYDEAICCYDQALEIDPRYVNAWNNKGCSLNRLGRYGEAIPCLDQALEIDARYANAWNNKGDSLDSLGSYEEALRCYDQALDIDSRFPDAWYNKGNSLDSLGSYEEALRCYDQTLDIDPRHLGAWINKGASLKRVGRNEEAINCFDQALELNPRLLAAWYNKGSSLIDLGRYEEAAESYRRFIALAGPQDGQLVARARQRLKETGG